MFKKIHTRTESNNCERYAYAHQDTDGSWLILGNQEWNWPYRFKDNQFEKIYLIEDLDEYGQEYCFVNFPLYSNPRQYITFEYLDLCVKYVLSKPEPLIVLIRLFRTQLDLELYQCKMLAQECITSSELPDIRAQYLKIQSGINPFD